MRAVRACCRTGSGGIFPFAGAEKPSLSIRDSTERGMQGQREGEVYMWIREAGIPLIGESSSNDQLSRISNPFCWSFPQAAMRHGHVFLAANHCASPSIVRRLVQGSSRRLSPEAKE